MAGRLIALFDNHRVGQNVLHLRNAAIELRLLVLRFVIFAVLREVTKGTRLLDLLRDFLFAGCLEIVELLFQP